MTAKDGRNRYGSRRVAAPFLSLLLAHGIATAQTPAPTGMEAIAHALGHLKATGAPLVVVVTSQARPESRAFARALIDGPWARSNRGLVQVVELVSESNAATVERLRVTSIPTVLAYTAGSEGPVCRGARAGGSTDEVVAWLRTLGIGDSRTGPESIDFAVTPALHDGYPSAQQPYSTPPPQIPAPPTYSYTPTYAAPPAPPPTYVAPVPTMAAPQPTSYVQLPGPNVVVQQGQPQVFLSQPAPQPAYGAPMMNAPNMYLPAAAPAPTAYAAQPSYAALPNPAAYAAQPSAPVGYAASPTPYAAVTNQTMALPTVGSRTRIRVKGPGPIRSGLATLGEKLTQLGRSRIETVQETDLNTPAVQGGGGVATFATSSTMPVGIPRCRLLTSLSWWPPRRRSPSMNRRHPSRRHPRRAPAKHRHFLKKPSGED